MRRHQYVTVTKTVTTTTVVSEKYHSSENPWGEQPPDQAKHQSFISSVASQIIANAVWAALGAGGALALGFAGYLFGG